MADAEVPPPRVYVFFDYNCPWSYVGKLRVDRLRERFELEIVWCGWELFPTIAPEGRPTPGVEGVRTDPVEGPMGALADELGETFYWPPVGSNTRLALRGLQHAEAQAPGAARAYHGAVFEAVWQAGENVGDLDVLAGLADEAGLDPGVFREAVDRPAYDEPLQLVDEKAEALGLVRRPTFVFGDQRIVGTAAFEPSLVKPLEAFIARWERHGPEQTTTLEEDKGLSALRSSARP